jgi:urease accessory protein
MINPGNSVKSSIAVLRLWQLISPALPVGAYAYSQGMEYATERGWIVDEAGAKRWIIGILSHTLARLDIPVLARLYNAWNNNEPGAVDQWNAFLLACRESAELKNEDIHLGTSLRKLLLELQVSAAAQWPVHQASSFANMFALAAAHWHIPVHDAAMGYLWAWSENQVAAAIKLVPLGQTAGQRILSAALERIPELVGSGLTLDDGNIGALAPALAIASALHESQYTRLFRS